MAVAFDAASSNAALLSALSTQTFAHTCSGSNRILLVLTGCTNATDASRNITGITYSGVALTQVREDNNNTSDVTTEIWYLVAPATGANNIVITYSGTTNNVVNGALSFTGVDQTSPIHVSNGTTGNGMDATATITTTVNNTYQVAVAFQKSNRTITVTGGQTSGWQAGSSYIGAAGYQAKATAGAVNPSFTWTLFNNDWAISVTSIKEVSAAGNNGFFGIL